MGRNLVLLGRLYIVLLDTTALELVGSVYFCVALSCCDNYRFKLPSPVRIVFCSFEPPLRGYVSFAKVIEAC